MEPAIRVRDLSKRYRIGAVETDYTTLREAIARAATAPVRRLSRRHAAGGAARTSI
jgi:hypothetical protein